MARAVTRRGLARGLQSRAFRTEELCGAGADHAAAVAVAGDLLYVESDGGGRLVVADARGAALSPAAALRALPLAADVQRRGVELCGSGGGEGGWRLRAVREAAPGEPVELWFDEEVLARVDMPFLTPKNILGRRSYACHECGAQFERPNPLKLHLFLSCEPYSAPKFWRRLLPRLADAPLDLTRAAAPPPSAFRPYRAGWLAHPILLHPRLALPPLAPGAAGAAAAAAAAEAEALATDWGKSKAGHLCLYCGKLYSRKYGLKIHIRTHTGYKPLQCKYCLRPFGDPSNLNKHVRLHARGDGGAAGEGEAAAGAAHACPRCGKLLVRRRDLLRHLRARHAHHHLHASPSPSP